MLAMNGWMITAADVLVCALILRVVLGWVVASRAIIRFLALLALVLIFTVAVLLLELPFARLLALGLVGPAVVVFIFSLIPEIRRSVQRFRFSQLFSPRRAGDQDLAGELADALIDLSEMRRGALIVLPGKDEISGLLAGGEKLTADATRSLILSVLSPLSPRHDGAIVIEEGKIQAVGVVLPLASADEARPEWGTRHLAAIGLTERCDADVLVVSEERGSISLAKGGQLRVFNKPGRDRLVRMLKEVLGTEDRQQARFEARIRSLVLWILSFIFGLVGSTVVERMDAQMRQKEVMSGEIILSEREAAIVMANEPAGLYVESFSPKSARIMIRAPLEAQEALRRRQFSFRVDLSGMQAGRRQKLPLRESELDGLQADWELFRVDPDSVEVELAAIQEATVPLRVRTQGLAKGLRLVSARPLVESIEVSVTDRRWRPTPLQTLPIDLSSIRRAGAFTFEATVEYPSRVRPKSIDPRARVRVEVVIEGEMELPAPSDTLENGGT